MSATDALNFFQSRGWTPAQSAGIVGNLHYESGGWNIRAVGDGGTAFGLGQWHPDRQADFRRVFGTDIRRSSEAQQLAFVDWELHNTESRAGTMLRRASTTDQSAYAVARYYERPRTLSSVRDRASIGTRVLTGVASTVSGGLRDYVEMIPGADTVLGIGDGLGLTGDCNYLCQFKNWILESGFFQRVALALLAFIILFAAFTAMKGRD
jgi:hypothetical protein